MPLSTPFENDPLLVKAWAQWLSAADPQALALLQRIADGPLSTYSDHFYKALFADPRAAHFLSSEQVQNSLKPALQRWLREILSATADDTQRMVSTNSHVGIAHARIGIPVDLVTRGFRELRHLLQAHIAELAGTNSSLLDKASTCCNLSMDIALEAMTQAYSRANEQSSRTDTAYRLLSLTQNMTTERERQRALLLDWENNLLYSFSSTPDANPAIPAQSLATSEFSLWLLHKGIPSFGESPETARILALIQEVDQILQEAAHANSTQSRFASLLSTRERLESIRNLLNTLFEKVSELDAASDALTNLLNRRFLPSVLRREIELANRKSTGLALVLLDIDHFKRINDQYSHETGDRVLQLVAETLVRHTRGSDYTFRLGGEEFVVVLGSVHAPQAQTIAETLRQRICATPLILHDGQRIAISVSIGVAIYDGHPDYMRMISQADKAMYAAKNLGRNRVEMAPPIGDRLATPKNPAKYQDLEQLLV